MQGQSLSAGNDLSRAIISSVSDHFDKGQFTLAYDKVLADTVKTFNRFRIIALLFAIDYSLRMNIFVLYAQSFDDHGSTATIGV